MDAMSFLIFLVTIISLSVLGLCYLLYVPIPAGFAFPGRVRIIYGTMRAVKLISALGEKLGYGPRQITMRKILHGMYKAKHRRMKPDESITTTDTQFNDVPVRIYTPKDKPDSSTGLVYFHGGGGVFGSIEVYDGLTRKLAKGINTVLVSVGYRQAPEHVFPVAFDDCVAAAKYFMQNATDFGVDPTRIAVAGDSTGGNLATVTALKLRDDGVSPPLKIQVLIYPTVQFANLQLPSYRQNAKDGMSSVDDVAVYRRSFIFGNIKHAGDMVRNLHTSRGLKERLASTHLDISKLPKDLVSGEDDDCSLINDGDEELSKQFEPFFLNPYACPLFAEDLSNLPMTYIFTGQNDVLRDEGFLYARRLTESGVLVKHRHSEIAYHSVFNHFDILPEANAYTEEVIEFVRNNL